LEYILWVLLQLRPISTFYLLTLKRTNFALDLREETHHAVGFRFFLRQKQLAPNWNHHYSRRRLPKDRTEPNRGALSFHLLNHTVFVVSSINLVSVFRESNCFQLPFLFWSFRLVRCVTRVRI
jgi:hypothetical protein